MMRACLALTAILSAACAASGNDRGGSSFGGATDPTGGMGDSTGDGAGGSPPGGSDGTGDTPTAPEDAGSMPAQPGVPVQTGGDEECNDVVDMVLAIDLSSSMGFAHSELRADIGEVVNAANALAPEAHFGLVGYVDNHAFDTSGDLQGGIVHTTAATLQTGFDTFNSIYTANDRNPGDGPSGLTQQNPICEENSLDVLHAAVDEFPWRDNATRVVIIATDDTFIEAPDNYGDRDADGLTDQTNFPREGDYPAVYTMAETITALQDARIRVFSFTLPGGTGLLADFTCGCGTGCRFGDSTHLGDGWSVPYNGQTPLPESTDGANFNLEDVRSGSLGLAETINQVVVDSYCVPPII